MEQKNLWIAIALSTVIMIGWMFLVQVPQQQAAQQQAAQQAPAQPAQTTVDGERKVVERDEALKESPRVAIDSPRLKGSINLKGARLDDLILKDFRETVEPTSPNIVLLSPRNSKDAYYTDFGWSPSGTNVSVPDKDTVWTADGEALAPGKPVTLTWDNGQGLTFARKFEIDADYMFTVTDTVTNSTGSAVDLAPYGRVVRYGTPASATIQNWALHEGPIGYFHGSVQEESYGAVQDQADEKVSNFPYPDSIGGWMGISDKYWLVTQIPPQDETLSGNFFYNLKEDFYQVDFLAATRSVPAGGNVTRQQHLFSGAKLVNLLEYYRDNLYGGAAKLSWLERTFGVGESDVPLFDRAVDFGYLWFLTKPLFWVLDHIYRWIGNFGVAILCLTVLVKSAMFPLANKSYRSMNKMKLLTPKIQELREKFGDDKTKLNQEMMNLYKTEKVNPAAGCLPILVQIPVFFALYKVIFVTIEMRHAPFFGWIRDLSAPDPTSILNLFGLIPWDYHAAFAIPLLGGLLSILSIGVWPLIMGFTMWLQMRLNPTPPDPVQAKIFALMPIVFTFMLAPFAAGLVIYWAWNNTLSIAQQKLIMWQMGHQKPSAGKTAG